MFRLHTDTDNLKNACVENVKPTVGCADPSNASCVCVSVDFVKGVAECARAPECAAADDAITNGISNGFCVGMFLVKRALHLPSRRQN